jgi:4-carboxymuconolactone decarboxylase
MITQEVAMRLSLLPPADPDATQRALYETCEAMTQGEEYQGLEVKTPDGAFVGPWGVMLHFPDLGVEALLAELAGSPVAQHP